MTEPAECQFHFERRLEGYPDDSILTMSGEQFDRLKAWQPYGARQLGLRVVFEHGSVLIAAKGTTVTVNYDQPDTVIVGSSDQVAELDGVGAEGAVQVRIETTVSVLEAEPRVTRNARLVPGISIEDRGVVEHFTGAVNLDKLAGQLISTRDRGGEPPGRIVGIGNMSPNGKLVGVDVTEAHMARLSELGKLSVFSPDIDSLYDLACPFDPLARRLRRWRLGPRFDPAEDQSSTPRERAHWFRNLNDAIGPMAVAASTRAAVRWCYALLEHEAIKRRRLRKPESVIERVRRVLRSETIESVGRWLHRCVGYGQRPSRAFACWILTAYGVTGWSVSHRAAEDKPIEWIERFLEVLLSPLRVLRLGGSSNGVESLVHSGLEPVAYVLVGLPFIFFVVSLRQFFRSPLNQRSPTSSMEN